MERLLLIIAISLLTVSCSNTQPVHGDMRNGKEKFLGKATGYSDGNGTITIRTENSVECKGRFEYTTSFVMGKGTFTCDDGRHGNFDFTSDGNSGRGFGKTNLGEPFRFTFGYPDATIQHW